MARAIGNITAYQLKYGVDPKQEYTLPFAFDAPPDLALTISSTTCSTAMRVLTC